MSKLLFEAKSKRELGIDKIWLNFLKELALYTILHIFVNYSFNVINFDAASNISTMINNEVASHLWLNLMLVCNHKENN